MKSHQARVLQIIANKTGSRPSLSDPIDQLGIDSLAMAEMIYDLESTFGIRTDDQLLELCTIQDLCDYLEERVSVS
ncbi:MAG: phosphopantetheine-binding protein [Pirellulaceae bacterium]|nr:phosphopantetheine-binding protein [Pirellulaceae bacterium]